MVRTRLRIRFRKQGDLRLIGHHDLVHAWERLLRRAGLKLRMSQGFHQRPKLSFPSALSIGLFGITARQPLVIEQLFSLNLGRLTIRDIEGDAVEARRLVIFE